MNRRELLCALAAGAIVTAEGLWMPGKRLISIPRPSLSVLWANIGPGNTLTIVPATNTGLTSICGEADQSGFASIILRPEMKDILLNDPDKARTWGLIEYHIA